MTTVYVVPCGVSILDKLPKMLSGSLGKRFTDLVTAGRWLDGVDQENGKAVPCQWSDEVADKAAKSGLSGVASRRLSAETHTLARRVTAGKIAADQHVVLLASQTPKGISAAFCVAQYLAGTAPDQIAYTSSPKLATDPFDLAITRAPVTVVRIRGLKPAGTDRDVAAMGIGKVLRAAGEVDGKVEVHLTGGYKATLLHTLALTEVLHSMAPGRVTAWNVFEDDVDSAGQAAEPLPIGLRTFDEVACNKMRRELAGKAKPKEEAGGLFTFEGLGWIRLADGTPQLTDFGHGYLAVLGDSPIPRGDDNS